MKRTIITAGIILAWSLSLWSAAAAGTVVLSDDFNGDAEQLNTPGDAVFTSTSPPGNAPNAASVDLVGPGFFSLCAPGQGNCVDLDGTTGSGNLPDSGQLTSNGSFGPGTYTLRFDLSGNERSPSPQTTDISLGAFSTALTLGRGRIPWKSYTTFSRRPPAASQFTDLGPSDQQGNLLDNVTLLSGVPEPASWAMMLLGVGLIGAGMRMARRKDGLAPIGA